MVVEMEVADGAGEKREEHLHLVTALLHVADVVEHDRGERVERDQLLSSERSRFAASRRCTSA